MKNIKIITSLLFVIVFIGCNHEKTILPKKYPYVITKEVENLDSGGVTFVAEVLDEGKQKIINYGFVWGKETNPTIADNIKLFNTDFQEGNFSFQNNSGLIDGQTYYVRAFIQTTEFKIYGNSVSFISQGSLPPVIHEFTPEEGPIGTEVIIRGKNFGYKPSENIVKIGSLVIPVLSATENELVVKIAMVTEQTEDKITVETASMTASSDKNFKILFPWKRIESFPGTPRIYSITFCFDEKAYIGLGVNYYLNENRHLRDLWEFDPKTNIFTQKSSIPSNVAMDYSQTIPVSFTANNKGYVVLGQQYGSDALVQVWEYDPATDTWTRKADFPGTNRIYSAAFNMNDKGYVVTGVYWGNGGWSHYPLDFWEYDPVSDNWTKKADFPESERQNAFAISLNNNAYVGIGGLWNEGSNIYKYNGTNNQWNYYTTYPGNARLYVRGFVINNKCYMGLGSNHSARTYSDFWEFDPETNTWNSCQPCPVAISPFVSFSIKSKGYIGLGYRHYKKYENEFFEFDPTKN